MRILNVLRSHSYLSVCARLGKDRLTLSVVSLLADTSIRESADQATRYTAATCPLKFAMNLFISLILERNRATHSPVLPSHSLTALSNPALAINRPSGEKATWLTCF